MWDKITYPFLNFNGVTVEDHVEESLSQLEIFNILHSIST